VIKLSDFVAKRLAYHGLRDVFMITGGGAMHLNMSLGREKKLRCIFNHHEQASAMAAESYARLSGKMAVVSVTSGPGGINALNGVWGAYVDSIPMLVVSGQVKYETTVRSSGLPLRQLGDQEFDITRAVTTMTKYAVMVTKPEDIQYHIDRAVYLAANGRPGPVWIDIPLNIQGAPIDEKKLRRYDPREDKCHGKPPLRKSDVAKTLQKLKAAKRPVILAGNGIRHAGAQKEFLKLAEKLGIPVLTAWHAHDLIPTSHPLCCGRPATVGDRPGNFIIQKADLLLSIGCRLNIRQVSYNWNDFAKNAYKIVLDIDPIELQKPTLKPDLPILADAGEFMRALSATLKKPLPKRAEWLALCRNLKEKYPAALLAYWKRKSPMNPYAFVKELSDRLGSGDVVVCANGAACVVGGQVVEIKPGMRMYTNSGCASMGYDLPAAIGAAVGGAKRVICLAGDGSVQMNLQELQTIVHNRLPIKVFWLNNNGYHSIRQTQHNFFGEGLVGCDAPSGVSFPDAGKIASAYGMPFVRCTDLANCAAALDKALSSPGCAVFEAVLDQSQGFEPRNSSRQLPDGRIVSAPYEDMYPFLSREEFESVMKS
jgi:acetolactate synthase-1/2/3 large subunit